LFVIAQGALAGIKNEGFTDLRIWCDSADRSESTHGATQRAGILDGTTLGTLWQPEVVAITYLGR
jgi:hypothetical protein